MKHLQNGAPYGEQFDEVLAEYDDDEMVAEFDDDDEMVAEYDDDDDSLDLEFDDDDDSLSGEFDDDLDEGLDAEYDDDLDEAIDAEFLGMLNPVNVIKKGIGGIRRLVRGPRRKRSYRSYKPKNYLRHRVGGGRFSVPSRSNMRGSLRLGRRQIPFRLPGNIATKTDVKRLAGQVRKDVRLNSVAIKKNAAGIRSAIGLARKANKGVSDIDKRYKKATLEQTKVTNAINKRVASLRKAQQEADQRAQQQAMFSLFMQPDIEKIKLKKPGETDFTEYEAKDADFETNLLPLILGMGGTGGKGGMDPMMMFALMQAMD
jgi:hypothetical protein